MTEMRHKMAATMETIVNSYQDSLQQFVERPIPFYIRVELCCAAHLFTLPMSYILSSLQTTSLKSLRLREMLD